ncbi:mechanosensitive ion channel family protein [Cyclobacterium jeungdonense]|uniref:Mechanosensitive ion channel family protein n=1 Tax=Cyclobacterium jeungdonense TaxID=708087 RepID=A0ABT8C1C5_9BACT|nr:mechanosensitive ion channel family protein [Cyclobacterium jeungdonense]MDN3686605.1 mechanosensitive ion channel family protein [Cyclobacterium jeungdonense]
MIQEYLSQEFWNNTIQDYLLALGFILLGIAIVKIFKKSLLQRIKTLTEKTDNSLDDFVFEIIERYLLPAIYISIVFWGIRTLSLSPFLENSISIAHSIILTYYGVKIIANLIIMLIRSYVKRQEGGEEKVKQIGGIILLVNVLIWAVGILFFFDNIGWDVTAIITGLGIGGIAVALAAQNILGDLFNYFVIFFDRPIEIGDFVVVDDKNGIVEKIGIKTTRIKTLSGEELVVANSDLTSSRIHNYKKMQRRRILFAVGVTYETPLHKLKIIPEMLKEIVENQSPVTFDRAHFKAFGDSSLDFEVVYYIEVADFNKYMDIQQQINFGIFERFTEAGISIAFPTRTLYLRNENEQRFQVDYFNTQKELTDN